MNKYNIAGAGFPADNETWMFIQTMIDQLGQLANIGGKDYILSGCEEAGGNVAAGWLVLDGKIVPFSGGALGVEVTLIETIEQATYLEDFNPADGQGDAKDTYFTYEAQFGNTGDYTVNWADLERLQSLIQVQKATMPIGSIIMWAGAINDLPEGWFLCDGNNGTPNLSGKFIVGYDFLDTDYDAIGKQGGEKEVTLTEGQMPNHRHDGSTNVAGNHNHAFQLRVDNTGSGDGPNINQDNANSDEGLSTFSTQNGGSHSHSFNTNYVGNDEAHENRPPFYTVACIQYRGI